MAEVIYIYVLVDKSVHKSSIYIYVDILLVGPELVKRRRLVRNIRVNDILL
jgi:hypothetical protein